MIIQQITPQSPLYEAERMLRNEVLLRPIGIPDHAWEMHDHRSWHFVAIDQAQVVGCVVLVPLDETQQKTQLIQMAVKDSHQGQGVGKKLVAALEHFALEKGIQLIECHARQEAVNFYLKLGYEIYGKPFEEVGILHRYMRKKMNTTVEQG
ncbi:GNAT family N-acetyltransferase [Microscilla marina]|uniref:Acetyltransferase, gnat family n=1 Tax=Microscilla marina ATCC 23134 TaxID=313606 RepID=A1ZFL8_MICM2|nr:GNAT family N-acetyltransferase [Microscilla marina]EAY30792.1 acetyltransferase, gnat family [Microscilla marina ATCC 23134]